MLRNYLILAWRNLLKYRLYSAINIGGLALGLSVCLLITLYVQHERSFDRFHAHSHNIARILAENKIDNEIQTSPYMSYATGPMIAQTLPEINGFIRIKEQWEKTVLQNPLLPGGKFVVKNAIFADRNFFSFFSFTLLKGSVQNALSAPFSIVIAQSLSEKYFGNGDPLGKTLLYNNTYSLTVSGVVADAPSNSSIQFEAVISISSLPAMKENSSFVNGPPIVQSGAFTTYVQLNTPADAKKLEKQLQKLAKSSGQDSVSHYYALPLTAMHLHSNLANSDSVKYLNIFPWIAGLILLLAITNYISLSTARSATRAKEIGVRKAMGAGRKAIAGQFFLESALCALIAFSIALAMSAFFQESFFTFLQAPIDPHFGYTPIMIITYVALLLVTILLAGFYPALLLSAYQPARVLYGKLGGVASGFTLRKFVTVFQFFISITLICCAAVIQGQMDFIRHNNTGLDKDNIVMIPFAASVGHHYPSFKKDISGMSAISGVATARYPLFRGTNGLYTKTLDEHKEILLPMMNVDQSFIPLLAIQWKIKPTNALYGSTENIVAINQAAINKLHLPDEPVGKSFRVGDQEIIIGGVIQDFGYASAHKKIDALCLFITADTSSVWREIGGYLFAKIQPHTAIPALLEELKSIYEKYDQENPFEYLFMKETFEAMYKAEDRLANLFSAFMMIGLCMACLGLLGLATYTAEQRTKEVGIRKVLGASVQHLAALLSRDFIQLVLLAVVISLPIAWWIMNIWLENFAYRISVNWWIFIGLSLGVTGLAFLIVSVQVIRVALLNPVSSLRSP